MANLITWSHFEELHEDKYTVFEDLCRALFRERFCPKDVILHSNPNNPGVEVEPVKDKSGKLISFQAKYFDNSIKYQQIISSANEIVKWYSEKIDTVYLYCNKPISSTSKHYVKAYDLLKNNNISLVLITDKEILDDVVNYPTILSRYFEKTFFSKDWFSNKVETTIKNLGGRYNRLFNIDTNVQDKVKLFLGYEDAIAKINARKNNIAKIIDYSSYNFKHDDPIVAVLNKIHALPDVSFTNLSDCFSWSGIIENEFVAEFQKANNRIKEILDALRDSSVTVESKEKLRFEQRDLEKLLEICENISVTDEERELINNKVIILTGEAGTGKSQLLANLTNGQIKDGKETLLFIGQSFLNSDSIEQQICSELQIDIDDWKSLLETIEEIGRRDNRYVLFAIDALNESKDMSIWHNGLVRFIDNFREYEHIKLIFSVRNGYESYILNDSVQESIANRKICKLEHYGFADESASAIYEFLNANNVPCSPEYYLRHEMYNPLFLTLFCKVYSGDDSFPSLVEKIIDKADAEAKECIGVASEFTIADELLKEWCEHRIKTGSYYISEDELLKFSIWNTLGIQGQKLNYLSALDKFGLITKLQRRNKPSWYIGYEKIGQYLVSKQIIDNSADKGDARAHIIDILGIASGGTPNYSNIGLFEMLSAYYAEKYKEECIDIVDTMDEKNLNRRDLLEAYYKGFNLRNKDSRALDTFIGKVKKYGISRDTFIEIFFENAAKTEHLLNALSLHRILYDMDLCVRDANWTIYINNLSAEDRIYNLVSYYEQSANACKGIPQEQIKLLLVLCMWLCTSSNIRFRDKVSRTVVGILSEHFEQSLSLLEMFSDVNDPYVIQRLYACIFGAIMRGNELNKTTLIDVAKIVYENIFNQKLVYPDILVRDYARLIIERIAYMYPRDFEREFDLSKIYPPYNSKPIPEADCNFIEEFKQRKENAGVCQISHSMAFNISRSRYGDFGRYVFQAVLARFEGLDYSDDDYEKKVCNIHDYALQMIFNDFGYNKLFEDYDMRHDVSFGRPSGKIERIGKKYQWLALYNILARISDVRKLKGWNFDDPPVKYEGAWQLSIRNFDPTVNVLHKKETLLPKFAETKSLCEEDFIGFDETQESSKKWAVSPCNFIKCVSSRCTNVDENGIAWVSLGSYDIQKSKPNDCGGFVQVGEQHIWTITRAFFIKTKDLKKVTHSTINTIDKIYNKLECIKSYELYGREYAWSEGYKSEFKDKQKVDEIEKIKSIVPAINSYVWEKEYIETEDNIVGFSMPNGDFINYFALEQKNIDGCYFDNNILVAYDSKRNGTEVLVRADYLNKYLKEKKLTLCWCLLTEKQYFYGVTGQSFGRWLGLYVYNGIDKVSEEKFEIVNSNELERQREAEYKDKHHIPFTL